MSSHLTKSMFNFNFSYILGHRKNAPPEKCPRGIAPLENCIPPRKKWFWLNYLLLNKEQFVYSIFFYYLFSCAYIFDLTLWHIMFIIHRYMTNNAGQYCPTLKRIGERFPPHYGATIQRRHYGRCHKTQI